MLAPPEFSRRPVVVDGRPSDFSGRPVMIFGRAPNAVVGAIHITVGPWTFLLKPSACKSEPPGFFFRHRACARGRVDREGNFSRQAVSKHFRKERTGSAPMQKKVQRRHDAHARAHGVCTEHSALFDATAGGQRTREALGTHVTDVERLLTLQEQSVQEGRVAAEQCRLSRRTLRNAAKAVVKLGKLANLDDAVKATLQLPGPCSDDEMLVYFRALLARVSSHADALVAVGLPPDLLKQLGDAIQAFASAKGERAACRERFTAAADAIRETLAAANKTVDALEAIVVNTPAGQPEVLTKLRAARRVGPRAAPAEAPKPAPDPVPPSAPTGLPA
jgi:hypothetical protein